tara:strand:- start:2517 stop:2672 length:156 start_codon:yes stop_codon:yes gene_type:complete
MTSKKQQEKWWRVKLDNETLNSIWDASKHSVEKNTKKYSRKNKHKKENHEE